MKGCGSSPAPFLQSQWSQCHVLTFMVIMHMAHAHKMNVFSERDCRVKGRPFALFYLTWTEIFLLGVRPGAHARQLEGSCQCVNKQHRP